MLQSLRQRSIVNQFLSNSFLSDKSIAVKNEVDTKKICKINENPKFPELQNIDQFETIDVNSLNEEQLSEQYDAFFEKLHTTMSNKKIKKNEFGITQEDVTNYLESFKKMHKSRFLYSKNDDILVERELKNDFKDKYFNYYENVLKLMKKFKLLHGDEDKTDPFEFIRKNRAISMANYIYQMTIYDYSETMQSLHTGKRNAKELLEELKLLDKNTKLDPAMFEIMSVSEKANVPNTFQYNELFDQIEGMETLDLHRYFDERVFGHRSTFFKNIFKNTVDKNEKLQQHYSQVLKILIVYFGKQEDFKQLNDILKDKTLSISSLIEMEEQKQIGAFISGPALLSILFILQVFMSTLAVQEIRPNAMNALESGAYQSSINNARIDENQISEAESELFVQRREKEQNDLANKVIWKYQNEQLIKNNLPIIDQNRVNNLIDIRQETVREVTQLFKDPLTNLTKIFKNIFIDGGIFYERFVNRIKPNDLKAESVNILKDIYNRELLRGVYELALYEIDPNDKRKNAKEITEEFKKFFNLGPFASQKFEKSTKEFIARLVFLKEAELKIQRGKTPSDFKIVEILEGKKSVIEKQSEDLLKKFSLIEGKTFVYTAINDSVLSDLYPEMATQIGVVETVSGLQKMSFTDFTRNLIELGLLASSASFQFNIRTNEQALVKLIDQIYSRDPLSLVATDPRVLVNWFRTTDQWKAIQPESRRILWENYFIARQRELQIIKTPKLSDELIRDRGQPSILFLSEGDLKDLHRMFTLFQFKDIMESDANWFAVTDLFNQVSKSLMINALSPTDNGMLDSAMIDTFGISLASSVPTSLVYAISSFRFDTSSLLSIDGTEFLQSDLRRNVTTILNNNIVGLSRTLGFFVLNAFDTGGLLKSLLILAPTSVAIDNRDTIAKILTFNAIKDSLTSKLTLGAETVAGIGFAVYSLEKTITYLLSINNYMNNIVRTVLKFDERVGLMPYIKPILRMFCLALTTKAMLTGLLPSTSEIPTTEAFLIEEFGNSVFMTTQIASIILKLLGNQIFQRRLRE